MSPSGGFGRSWQSLRSLPDRTPLRVKMITAVLALVIIALLVISFATRAVAGSYLNRQAQGQLENYYSGICPTDNSCRLREYSFYNQGLEQVWVLNAQGQPVRLSAPDGAPAATSSKQPPLVPTSQAWLQDNAGSMVTLPDQSGNHWLVITNQITLATITQNGPTPQTFTLAVGYPLSTIDQDVNILTEVDLLVSAAVVIVLALIGVAVVRASLRPLTDIEHTAAAIAGGDLSSRIPDRDPRTEVGRLGMSLNAMLTQIETAFDDRTRSEEAARESEQRMRQFLADASHELRTPLTAIRGFAEYYRQRGGVADVPEAPDQSATDDMQGLTRADLDRIMRRLEQESSRMGVLVEDMLLLARLDQQRPLERHLVDMLTLAADAVHDARVVAPERTVNLTVDTGTAPIVVGDEVRLRQVIGNLMSNALSHTPEGLPIEVRLRSGSLDEWRTTPPVPPAETPAGPATETPAGPATAAAGGPPGGTALAVAGMISPELVPAVVLEVADSGPGLTPEQAAHVFERFYRADAARTRKAGGAGLGLAIVSALVAAHGGTVWVESPPGGGATFRIAIPLAPEARYTEPDSEDAPEPESWHNGLEPGGGTESDTIDSGHRFTRWR
jgi:two-component system OmpR family sensor kinase